MRRTQLFILFLVSILACCAQKQQEYFNSLYSELKFLEEDLQHLINYHYLTIQTLAMQFDPLWRSTVTSHAFSLKRTAARIRALRPPLGYTEVHKTIAQAMDHMEQGCNLYLQWLNSNSMTASARALNEFTVATALLKTAEHVLSKEASKR